MTVIIHRRHRIGGDPFAYDDSSVTSITEDRLRVRQNPTNYLPNIDKEGIIHLADEAISNAIDETENFGAVGSEVIITYDEKTRVCSVQDEGRGFPHNMIFKMCEVLTTGAKMGKNKAYGSSGGVHGTGLKLVNFLTAEMFIRSEREGKYTEIKYVDGVRTSTKTGKSKEHGTYLEWTFDPTRFFKDRNVTCEDILNLVTTKSYVSTRTTIIFKGKKADGQEITKVFKNNSLKDYMTQKKVVQPIVSGIGVFGGDAVEFTFGYNPESEIESDILAYTNNIFNKSGGSHTDGLVEALITVLRKHMEDVYLTGQDKGMKLKAEDFRVGLVGIISVRLENVEGKFRGQHKEALDDALAKRFVMDSVRRSIRMLDTAKLNKLASVVKQNAKARIAAESGRKKVRKDVTNMFSENRIEEYTPVSKTSTSPYKELFIVEGKSAKGGMESECDPHSQALLSIRGKNDNTFDMTPTEVLTKLKNDKAVVKHLHNIMQCGIGKTFNLEDCPFDRINFATDADSDGGEIAAQLGTTIYQFFRPLVDAGRVYRVVPPLYEIIKDGKTQFLPSTRDFMTLTQNNFASKHSVYLNGKKMPEEDVISMLVDTEEYVNDIHRAAVHHGISDTLCEFLVANVGIGFTEKTVPTWQKALKARFPFLKVQPFHGHIAIIGTTENDEFNRFEYADDFLDTASKITKDHAFYGYSIDNKNENGMSLYQIVIDFDKYKPKVVRRYKGLGEMDGKDLARTMLDRKARHSQRLVARNGELTFEKLATHQSQKEKYAKLRKQHMKNAKFDLMKIDT